jgi:hypothetical protein
MPVVFACCAKIRDRGHKKNKKKILGLYIPVNNKMNFSAKVQKVSEKRLKKTIFVA